MNALPEDRPRYSVREARSAVLAAGRELLIERGFDTGLGRVSLNDAIVASGVPRASAYRAFSDEESDPQEAFRMGCARRHGGRVAA